MPGTPLDLGAPAPRHAEIAGAARIKWGALLGLAGLSLAIVGIFLALTAIPLGSAVVTTSAGSNALMNTIYTAVLAVVAGVFLAILSFAVYVTGFASLRKADTRFRTPMVLSLVGLVGLALIAGFTLFYAASVHAALACSPSDVTCQNHATTLGHGTVVLGYLGGLLGFLGLVGAILGLFRFGSRYGSSLAKAGAILYLIPFAAVLAPLLVLVGAHQVQKKLGRPVEPAPSTGPMAPIPPPPA